MGLTAMGRKITCAILMARSEYCPGISKSGTDRERMGHMKMLQLLVLGSVALAMADATPLVDAGRTQETSGSARATPAVGDVPSARATTIQGDAEHGRYLVERVVMCAQCHSPRDEHGNIIEERRFTGAPIPVRRPLWATNWAIHAPRNRGLPGYTVEQGIRLLTQGAIARDGRQLRPPMPPFRMTPQDAADVVAYFKSMK